MIVLPMAGMSSRFFKAGYTVPKYMLEIEGLPVFDYALRSFSGRFGLEPFLIVLRPEFDTEAFVRARLAANGISADLVVLDAPTAGQATTVAIGVERAGTNLATPLTIFNIDSFRPGFHMTDEEYAADGYLETFIGEGNGWSFVESASADSTTGKAIRVVEKERISPLCSTGLYYFRTLAMFRKAYECELAEPSQPLNEHYIAPVYNKLIAGGSDIRFRTIPAEDVIFCGIPAEYDALRADSSPVRRLRTGTRELTENEVNR